MPDDSPSGSDYWSCYIPGVVTNKLGLVPEEHELYVLTIGNKALLAKFLQHRLDRPELREDIATEIASRTGREVGLAVCGNCHYFEEDCTYERPVDYPKELGEEPLCPQDWAFSLSLADQILALIPEEEEIRKQWRYTVIEEIEVAHGKPLAVDSSGVLHLDIPFKKWRVLKEG